MTDGGRATALHYAADHDHSEMAQLLLDVGAAVDPENKDGMTPLMKSYVAGLLAHASEVTYFLAPYINSYKRFVAGTFAPTKAIWSTDNRTAGYRLCGADTKGIRIECRVGDPVDCDRRFPTCLLRWRGRRLSVPGSAALFRIN